MTFILFQENSKTLEHFNSISLILIFLLFLLLPTLTVIDVMLLSDYTENTDQRVLICKEERFNLLSQVHPLF